MAFDQAAVKTCLSIGATSSKALSESSCAKAEHGSLLVLSTRCLHLVLWICGQRACVSHSVFGGGDIINSV